jgi:AcrR family transcriptional regulator
MPELPAWLPAVSDDEGGTGSARRVRGDEMVRKILDAGRVTFRANSYEGARVDDIVHAAGISHGAFYLYFRNKEDLLRRMAVECAARLQQLAGDLDAMPRPIQPEPFAAWIDAFVSLYHDDGPVIRVWLDNRDMDPLMQALANDSLGPLTRALAAIVDPATAEEVGSPIAGLAMLSMLERFSSYFATIDPTVVTGTTTRLLFATTVGATSAPSAGT